MATKKRDAIAIPFGELIDEELGRRGSTRRWLMAQLKNIGLDLTDTQLSNRCKGFIPFGDDEKTKINQVLGTDFK